LNLPPNTSTRVKINVSGAEEQIALTYTANNFLVAPEKGMPVKFVLAPDLTADVQVASSLPSAIP
jgi:hypothetical protein